MRGMINTLLFLILMGVLTFIGANTFGFWGGLVGFAVGIVVLIILRRATLLFIIGNSKYNAGNHEKAYKWMKKAYNTSKLSPSLALMYAYMMIRDGMLAEAEAVINKVTYLNAKALTKEDKLTAELNKAIIKWKQDNLEEGIEILEDIYNSGLKSTTLYGTLGYFYLLNNQISKALEFNKEGYEYNCDNMIIGDNLGASYIANSEFDKADEVYTRLFEQKPEFIEPYYNYGMLMEKRGMYDEAKSYYERALKYPEKYLSTIKHDEIKAAIENVEMFSAGEKKIIGQDDTGWKEIMEKVSEEKDKNTDMFVADIPSEEEEAVTEPTSEEAADMPEELGEDNEKLSE